MLPTGGKFKFGGDPNVKVDIGGGLGGSSTIGSKTAKKYDFSKIPSVTAPPPLETTKPPYHTYVLGRSILCHSPCTHYIIIFFAVHSHGHSILWSMRSMRSEAMHLSARLVHEMT